MHLIPLNFKFYDEQIAAGVLQTYKFWSNIYIYKVRGYSVFSESRKKGDGQEPVIFKQQYYSESIPHIQNTKTLHNRAFDIENIPLWSDNQIDKEILGFMYCVDLACHRYSHEFLGNVLREILVNWGYWLVTNDLDNSFGIWGTEDIAYSYISEYDIPYSDSEMTKNQWLKLMQIIFENIAQERKAAKVPAGDFEKYYDEFMTIDTTDAFPFEITKVFDHFWEADKQEEAVQKINEAYGWDAGIKYMDDGEFWKEYYARQVEYSPELMGAISSGEKVIERIW